MTMTLEESRRIIDLVSDALLNRVSPVEAEQRAMKKFDRRVLTRLWRSKYFRLLPKPLRNIIAKSNGSDSWKTARRKAREQVLRTSPFKNYQPWELDAAFKIGIAEMYLYRAKNSVSEQVYADYVNSSSPMMLQLQGWIEVMNPETLKMLKPWGEFESSTSFSNCCVAIGSNNPQYWQAVYERIGLEHTSASPHGNA
ncbi:MAG: hypothetical protein Q8922_04475 [Bacteroidota bacterium]|nr:hypothetical protein [Bacteroidota bacterium]MDP4231836.1 hypothetical protein [Bacteroidota bacterium]MDP4242722.1 hypothetical protein [Bacteroidota bacterium]MDP4287173.1 hypothetical protein [Bacteroidota bacterium]